jgi:hypothetical protein
MKLQIDISDRGQLRAAESELSRLLKIVQFALTAFDPASRNGSQAVPVPIETTNPAEAFNSTPEAVLRVIHSLPKRLFSTTDVMLRMGDEAKQKRAQIKQALKRAVTAGFITCVKPGRGRRPTKYRRVSAKAVLIYDEATKRGASVPSA